MISILLALLFSFVIAFTAVPIIIRFARERDLLDEPGGRKIHKARTPALGGVGIFAGLVTALTVCLSLDGMAEYKYFFGALMMIVLVGIRDDFSSMMATPRLFVQLSAAFVVVVIGDVRLDGMFGLLGLEEIGYWPSVLLSVFTVIVITNAYNLIDGIDGLAGSVSVISLSLFGYWFFLQGEQTLAVICASLVGGIVGFLFYNFSPASIFMGDTGSTMIGFTCSAMAILFINANEALPVGAPFKFDASIATAVALMIYPLYDTLRVFVFRAWCGRSPLSGDKSHLHHLLLRLKFNHAQATSLIAFVSAGFALAAWLMQGLSDRVALPVVLLSGLWLILAVDFTLSFRYSKRMKQKLLFAKLPRKRLRHQARRQASESAKRRVVREKFGKVAVNRSA